MNCSSCLFIFADNILTTDQDVIIIMRLELLQSGLFHLLQAFSSFVFSYYYSTAQKKILFSYIQCSDIFVTGKFPNLKPQLQGQDYRYFQIERRLNSAVDVKLQKTL